MDTRTAAALDTWLTTEPTTELDDAMSDYAWLLQHDASETELEDAQRDIIAARAKLEGK